MGRELFVGETRIFTGMQQQGTENLSYADQIELALLFAMLS